MTTETETKAEDRPADAVEDVGDMMQHLFAWHEQVLVHLEIMAEIPEGTPFSVNDSPPIKLEGDTLAAFTAGIMTALSAIKQLPFVPVSLDSKESGLVH